jgi:hypothetical protein
MKKWMIPSSPKYKKLAILFLWECLQKMHLRKSVVDINLWEDSHRIPIWNICESDPGYISSVFTENAPQEKCCWHKSMGGLSYNSHLEYLWECSWIYLVSVYRIYPGAFSHISQWELYESALIDLSHDSEIIMRAISYK